MLGLALLFSEVELNLAYALHIKLLTERSPQLVFSAPSGSPLLRVASMLSSFDGSSHYLNLATTAAPESFQVENSQTLIIHKESGIWVDQQSLSPNATDSVEILRALLGILEGSTSPINQLSLADTFAAERLQARRALDDLTRLRFDDSSGVIVGESFTFGRVYLTLLEAFPEMIDQLELWGWYHPERKIEVGVPERFVDDDLIAEPETVIAGVTGLSKSSPSSILVLGTSGWANTDGTDQFSVAVKGPQGVRALRVEVNVSKNHPRSLGKRRLTQDLGVVAAVMLLLEQQQIFDSTARSVFEEYTSFAELIE